MFAALKLLTGAGGMAGFYLFGHRAGGSDGLSGAAAAEDGGTVVAGGPPGVVARLEGDRLATLHHNGRIMARSADGTGWDRLVNTATAISSPNLIATDGTTVMWGTSGVSTLYWAALDDVPNWSSRTLVSPVRSIAHRGGRWLVGRSDGVLEHGPDPAAPTVVDTGAGVSIAAIARLGSGRWLFGCDSSVVSLALRFSDDLVGFSGATSGISRVRALAVEPTADLAIAVQGVGYTSLATSKDGASWTHRTTASGQLTTVAVAPGVAVAGGADGLVLRSTQPDTALWSAVTSGFGVGDSIEAIVHAG